MLPQKDEGTLAFVETSEVRSRMQQFLFSFLKVAVCLLHYSYDDRGKRGCSIVVTWPLRAARALDARRGADGADG